MKKDLTMFFAATTLGMVAVFVLSVELAHAYAIPGAGTIEPQNSSTAGSTSAVGSDYHFGNSFQNLISPFTNFFQSIQSNTTGNVTVQPVTTMGGWSMNASSSFNVKVDIGSIMQNLLNGFNNWFYHVTGIQISGVTNFIFHLFSWFINFLNGVVNWIVGLTKA